MKNKRSLRTIHANANEHQGYWQVRITVDTVDREGLEENTITWRQPTKAPDVDGDLDQAWVLLVLMVHLLEKEGAAGRIATGDWPGLW